MSISMVVSVDARYINYRCPANSNFRTTYMRRRTQLLRKYAAHHNNNPAVEPQQPQHECHPDDKSREFSLQNYLDTRKKILNKKYGVSGAVRSSADADGRYSRSDSLTSSLNHPPPPPASDNKKSHARTAETSDSAQPLGAAPDKLYIINLHENKKSIRTISMCRDGMKFACCCSDDNSIALISLSHGTIMFALEGHQKPVVDIQWLPNADQWLVSCSYDATLRLWDCNEHANVGRCIRVCRDPSSLPILCFAAFPLNGNIVLTCNASNQLCMLNFSTGRFHSKPRVKLSSHTVNAMVFDDVGHFALIGDNKGVLTLLRLENIATGKLTLAKQYRMVHAPVTSLSSVTKGSGGNVDRFILCSLAANLLLLLKLSNDGGLILYREFRGAILHRQLAVKSCFSISGANNKQAAVVAAVSGSEDGRVHIFDTDRHGSYEFQAHNCPVLAVGCCQRSGSSSSSIDGRPESSIKGFYLVSGDQSGQVAIWHYDVG